MAKRPNKRLILIVCEGQRTEPNYFERLDKAVQLAKEVSEVSMLPQESQKYLNPFLHEVLLNNRSNLFDSLVIQKPQREDTATTLPRNKPSRKLLQAEDISLLRELMRDVYGAKEGDDKYEEYKAVPVNFVALAATKNEQEDSLYEEIWAVYDQNGHNKHKEARALAAEKGVNIAFSARSFEYWILLHFERTTRVFSQTVCKEKDKESKGAKEIFFDCGLSTSTHPKDCKGANCLVGYLRKSGYLPNYAKSDNAENLTNMMRILLSEIHLLNALENAAYARYHAKKQAPCNEIYEHGAWTDVDILVKKLLGINIVYAWASVGENIEWADMKNFKIDVKDEKTLILTARNIKINPYTWRMYLKNADRQAEKCEINSQNSGDFSIIRANNRFEINLPFGPAGFDFCIELDENILLIALPKV